MDEDLGALFRSEKEKAEREAALNSELEATKAHVLTTPPDFLSRLPGEIQATFSDAECLWLAHDTALIRVFVRVLDMGGTLGKAVRSSVELTLWHDVRDVEVSCDVDPYGLDENWSILIQYPRLSMTLSGQAFGDFCLAVARLAK